MIMKVLFIALCILVPTFCFSQKTGTGKNTPMVKNQTMIDEFITEPTTLRCAGFEWKISGDENRNAEVALRYRKQGST
ncbi:MAG: hypothetical protein C0490_14965, partial [Marivirga sp.]|nr:hypothetical protein [Marivirga sp.]